MSDITITGIDAGAIDGYRSEMGLVHQAAFGRDGAYMETYRDAELPEMATYPGFRCFAAHDHGRMIGFVLGHDADANPAWYRNVAGAVRETPIAAWLEGAWYLGDIAVHPEWQGQGIGSALHDRIIDTVPGRDLVLITFHGDHPAQRFYRRHGWRVLVADFVYRPGAPLTTLMGR
jgi:ribosomal protein S18 acetylase RimI-like enzyme